MAETILDIAMTHSEPLVVMSVRGDKQAQGKLVQLWYKRIYNYAFKFLSNHDLAMEAAQKTFISMHSQIGNLKDTGRFKSWLYTIAVNNCRDEVRGKKTDRYSEIDSNALNIDDDRAAFNPERKYRHLELTDILQKCLGELSSEQREVIIMKEYEGLKFKEIAEALNIPENTAKSRMYNGLYALKQLLDKKNIRIETI